MTSASHGRGLDEKTEIILVSKLKKKLFSSLPRVWSGKLFDGDSATNEHYSLFSQSIVKGIDLKKNT